jgi:hypothetical protein
MGDPVPCTRPPAAPFRQATSPTGSPVRHPSPLPQVRPRDPHLGGPARRHPGLWPRRGRLGRGPQAPAGPGGGAPRAVDRRHLRQGLRHRQGREDGHPLRIHLRNRVPTAGGGHRRGLRGDGSPSSIASAAPWRSNGPSARSRSHGSSAAPPPCTVLYGALQGIVGAGLPSIPALELDDADLLEDHSGD